MAERPRTWWLSPRIVLPALVGILVLTAILAPTEGDTTGRELSTRSRAMDGAHGLRAVLDRLGWHTRERLTPYAGALDTTATYVHNQALMELGALVCTARSRACTRCPVRSVCDSYASHCTP